MDFYINKHSTLPYLQTEIIMNNEVDIDNFNECIETADITFCMKDPKTGRVVVSNKPALISSVEDEFYKKYYTIGYKFTSRETSQGGKFVGKFTFSFKNGRDQMILPIYEELFINILE